MRGMGGSAVNARRKAGTLWRWGRRAIGKGVGRLLVAELAMLLVTYGLASNLIDPLLRSLLVEVDLRAVSFVVLSVTFLAFAGRLRAILLPSNLSSLARQPVDNLELVFLTYPWATLLAWPWLLVVGFGQPAPTVFVLASTVATIGVIGLCATRRGWRRLVWASALGASLIVIDRHEMSAYPLALLAVTIGVGALETDLRAAFGEAPTRSSRQRSERFFSALWRTGGSPLAALLRRDLLALWRRPGWVSRAWLPIACALFLLLVSAHGNGNCHAACLDRGVLFLVASSAIVCVAVLSSIRHVQGPRWLTPDRTVPPGRRLLSLGLIAAAPCLPFIALAASLSAEPSLLPFSISVVLISLYRQLADPDRDVEIGMLLCSVVPLLFMTLLPVIERLLLATGVLLILLYLVNRQARRQRHASDTAGACASAAWP